METMAVNKRIELEEKIHQIRTMQQVLENSLRCNCLSWEKCFKNIQLSTEAKNDIYFLAGLAEIAGGYFVWIWLRYDASIMWGILGGIVIGDSKAQNKKQHQTKSQQQRYNVKEQPGNTS